MNVPAGAKVPLVLKGANATTQVRLGTHDAAIKWLARIDSIDLLDGAVPEGAVSTVLDEVTLILPLIGVIDLEAEKARLTKEIAKAQDEMGKVEKKLANKGFLAKAPEEVVAENRTRLAEYAAQKEKLAEALARLAGA
jgi:valyl-tRNA synthetase